MFDPESGVRLSNLNWGYQVVYSNIVIAAIHDTQGGPRRSPECMEKATAIWNQHCALFKRARWMLPVVTDKQLYVLARICKEYQQNNYTTEHAHGNRLHALQRRGLKELRPGVNGIHGYLEEWQPVFVNTDAAVQSSILVE